MLRFAQCTDSFRRCRQPVKFGEDGAGGLGPDEGLGGLVVGADVAGDSVLEIGHGLEDAPADASAGDDREEALDGVGETIRPDTSMTGGILLRSGRWPPSCRAQG